MTELLAKHQPTATAVESLFFNVNVRTALAVGQARGVTLLACSQAGCEVFEYTPQQIKQAVVGYGKADQGAGDGDGAGAAGPGRPPEVRPRGRRAGGGHLPRQHCGMRDGIRKAGDASGAREPG